MSRAGYERFVRYEPQVARNLKSLVPW